jgi:SAM-dependent methyltransferase
MSFKKVKEYFYELEKQAKYKKDSFNGYIPSEITKLNNFNLKELLGIDQKEKKPLFLEFGCGYGKNVIKAALWGYEAYGVDLRERYVKEGNELIEHLKFTEKLPENLDAKLFFGNMFTKEYLEILKNRWIDYNFRETDLSKKEINNVLNEILNKGLEKTYSENYEHEIHNFEDRFFNVYYALNLKRPKLLLENPYQPEDVYDKMGHELKDFDVFYSWPWTETANICEMFELFHDKNLIWKTPNNTYIKNERRNDLYNEIYENLKYYIKEEKIVEKVSARKYEILTGELLEIEMELQPNSFKNRTIKAFKDMSVKEFYAKKAEIKLKNHPVSYFINENNPIFITL